MKKQSSKILLTSTLVLLAMLIGLLKFDVVYATVTEYPLNGSGLHNATVKGVYDSEANTLAILGEGFFDMYSWHEMAKALTGVSFEDNKWNEFDAAMIFQANLGERIRFPRLVPSLFENYGGTIDFGYHQVDTSHVEYMAEMFKDAKRFNSSINDWDVSSVTNMTRLFCGASDFNQPLDNWNTVNVREMVGVFEEASSFNKPIDDWNMSSAFKISSMFKNATSFNQPLENWNLIGCVNADSAFENATSFNRPLNNWNTSNFVGTTAMFKGATAFNQRLDKWDMSSVRSIENMFNGATAFNQEITAWDTSNVVDMEKFLYNATSFNKDVKLNTSKARDISSIEHMFANTRVKSIIIEDNTPQTTFRGPSQYSKQDLKYFEFSNLMKFEIDGFAGDYIVEEIVESGENILTEKGKDDSFEFAEGKHYRVYLHPIGVPPLVLSKSGSAIKVSWTAVPDVTGYQVYRADKASGPFTKYKTTSLTSYTNSGNLVPGMPYYYKVRAYKKEGSTYTFGDFSTIKGYYAPGALATPAKPNLSLDKNGNGIRLNWNSQKRITGYQVFRSLSPDKPFSYLKTASGNATKYTNLAGLTQGRPYYYKVRAYRMAKGARKYSAFTIIKGMFAGTNEYALGAISFSLEDNPGVSAPNVRVRWSKVGGAAGYCIYRWNGTAKQWIGLKKTGPNARVYTNINGVANHKTNYYGMRPYHISGGTTYYGNIGQAKGYRVDK